MAIQTTYAMSVYGPYSITQSRDLHNYIWNKKIKKAKKNKKISVRLRNFILVILIFICSILMIILNMHKIIAS